VLGRQARAFISASGPGLLMPRVPSPPAPGRTRIIAAAHERLVVTYSALDNAVYLLIPPGEDPRTVLRTARLVLHDSIYLELAAHLGVASTDTSGAPRRQREPGESATRRTDQQ
jgi:hypothetical protein